MKRRILSIITALALCLSLCPAWALAAEADPSLCKHHPAHTAECGYTAPTEGHYCGHRHTAECYTLGVLPDADGGDYYEIGADTANLLDCPHSHDSECGYVQADPGTPCGYECRICPIEDLIAALPDTVTEDNAADVRAQLDEILALYRELNEDEQGQIDLSHVTALQEKLDAVNVSALAVEGTPDLELFGQEVRSGDSGEGWSYADGVLTLENFHSDSSSENFIHITNSDLEFTLHVKGDNSVKTSGKLIWGSVYGSMTITGEQGASLSLDGKSWSDRYIFIRGVNMDVTMQEMIFLAYDMEIDNATVNFNMNGSNGYIYTTHGGFTIKNGSDVTITNSSGAVDYCVATNKAVITDSALKVTNPSGFGVYVTNISTQVSEYKAFITNSTISADVSNAAIHCEDEMAVTNSQVTGIGRFLLRSKKAITVDDSSTMEGITYEFFKSDTGATYQVYGSHTPAANLTVAEKDSFVIPEGAVLTIPDGIIIENNGTMRIHEKDSLTGTGALTGNGKFLIDVNEDMISVPEGLVYTGKDYTDQIILEENATVCGVEFTADTEGWTRNIEPAVVKEAGEYTVTFTSGNKEISKTFTVAQSGTDLTSEGKVKIYNGSEETTSFTAGDTIKVVAAPTPTGKAPQKAAARLRGDPDAGQMAMYVGNNIVSNAVEVAADDTYTMTVSADDVLIYGQEGENGKYTLIAKFVGNTNMADAEAQVEVTITPNPLTADMVTMSAESGTYSGTGQKPTVTVTGLTEGTDYDIAYTGDFTSAGEHMLTVTGKGVYRGTVEKTYTIGKATPTIAWNPIDVETIYTGQPADVKLVVTLVNGEKYTGEIHYSWYGAHGWNDSLVPPTDARSYANIRASIPEQDNYNAAITKIGLNLYIGKADQDAPAAPTAEDANIKDTSITLTVIENAEYSIDGTSWQESPTFTRLDPNQAYTFYARLKEDDNHNASPSSTGTSITTRKAMLENASVTVSGTYTYTGAAIVPPASEVAVMLNGKPVDSDQYTISASNNINAGVAVATLTATATENGNYSGSVSSTFTIAPATLTITASDQTITYGGSIATGTDQVTPAGLVGGDTLESVTLEASSDQVAVTDKTITPSAAQIRNTSGADVTGNYKITYEMGTLTINKAQSAVTVNPTANTLTYNGTTQALVTAGTASIGEVVYSLTETGTYSTTIPTGTDAGSYTVWYKVEGTENYNGTAPVKVDVTISKVNYTGEKTGSTSGKFGMTKTYDLQNLLPDGYKLGPPTKTDTNNIFDGDPTVNEAVLTYKLADSAGIGKTGTITIPVTESTNYNPFDLTITVTVTDKIVPTLTVSPITVTFDGKPIPDTAIEGIAKAGDTTVPGSWRFDDGQALTNVADSGTKTVIFTPADEVKADYVSATGTVRVTITKAATHLSLKPSPATLPNGGTVTLTLSCLPSGGSATVTCSDETITVTKGSDDTWTAELPAGGASYTFTATYAGDGNHNGATANCTVSVEKITPVLSLTASPASPLIGGGTVTLTLSGLPAGGMASVTCSGGITVTAEADNTWTAELPNSTADYTFTASYEGNGSYHGANATCTVKAKEVVILPNPPADEGNTKFQLVMEDGISEVPAGLQSIETLNTPEKLETAMRTEITKATPGIPEANTAVYDVELQISTDGGATWTPATKDNFPANGLTVTLPYPAGTNGSYTFTVVHMFTTSDFDKTPGDTEMPRVTNTASGLQFTVTGLSPISVGWTAPATTPDPPTGGNHGGGGWSSSTYAVTVEKSEHGKVTSNRTNASNGSTVTLTVTPDSGYVLDVLTVTDSRGNEIKLTAQGGNKYTFTMPSRAVTVKASFVPLPDDTQKPCDGGADCPSHGFTDLGTVGTWYHEAVDYVLRNGLMNGYSNGTFGPNNNLTRAQFAQILFNKEGRPVVNYLLQYSDVAEGAWYTEAIRWATSRGIVGGYGNGMFGPNDNITREQLAVMLWRYAGSPAATDKELHFTDADKASGYALEALRWAVENGVMSGKGGGILDPRGLATRAQTAQMLKNFLNNG